MKTVLGWVVNWSDIPNAAFPLNEHYPKRPNVTVDLFFSSKEKFKDLLGKIDNEILVPINVPDDFDELDFIPDNY